MARSGGSGRLAPRRGSGEGMAPDRTGRAIGSSHGSPLLVLHRAPLVARATEKVAQIGYQLSDAADVEPTAPVGVAVDPAASDLVAKRGARDLVEVQDRVLTREHVQLGVVGQASTRPDAAEEPDRVARARPERA